MYMVFHRYLRRNPPLSPSFCSSASPLSIRKPKRRVNANRYTRDRNYARILFLSVHTPSTFPSCQLVHLSAMVGVVVGGATDNIAAGLVNRRRRLHRLMLLPLRMAGEALLGHVAVVGAGRCRDLAAPVVVVRAGAGGVGAVHHGLAGDQGTRMGLMLAGHHVGLSVLRGRRRRLQRLPPREVGRVLLLAGRRHLVDVGRPVEGLVSRRRLVSRRPAGCR